ncbi:ribonuclease HI family protein [Sinomonas sp. JGH33]|uniref:ribonuclease H n=1 Tax=Sinomonas terricola TaxID=3110330 RepID=A0ABU5T3U7_9MICC|nr:ribonuclease HI family protein [Sinomonas sp. JGH33]MEA5454184.1 ribonuclease HI family protein [Sinomonas sp. JGH33]
MTITAAADGSALGNPGPAGWAWYVDEDRWHAGGWPHGTNNQGELMAVLDLFRSTAHLPEEPLRILCDSQYVINCVTKWMPNWKRRGWTKADGKPVLNSDLLKQIDRELVGRTYTFEWVKGHAGHSLNEAADERARACATAYQAGGAPVEGPGFPSRAAAQPAVPAEQPSAEAVQEDLFGELTGSGDESMNLAQGAIAAADGHLAMPGRADIEAVVELEQELLEPETRGDFGQLAYLLHPEYREIGQSGRLWDRDEIVDALVQEPELNVAFELVEATPLGPDLIQVLYRTESAEGSCLRCSLWQRTDGRWRIRFHQGTPEA